MIKYITNAGKGGSKKLMTWRHEGLVRGQKAERLCCHLRSLPRRSAVRRSSTFAKSLLLPTRNPSAIPPILLSKCFQPSHGTRRFALPRLFPSSQSPSLLFLPQVSSFPFLVERQSGRTSRKPRVLLLWEEIQVSLDFPLFS